MSVWLDKIRRFRARTLISALVLVSFCASFVPLPVVSRAPIQKDQSAPFPCQHRPCGCQSAEACWKGCCCFTNREKLAWAEANGVTPPAYVIAAAEKEATTPVCTTGGCCSKATSTDVVEVTSAKPNADSCCSSAAHFQDDEVIAEDETETQFVIGVFLQKCQGQGLFWNSLPWAILPVLEIDLAHADPGLWLLPVSHKAPARAVEPPEPPPRVVSAVLATV